MSYKVYRNHKYEGKTEDPTPQSGTEHDALYYVSDDNMHHEGWQLFNGAWIHFLSIDYNKPKGQRVLATSCGDVF